MTITKAKYENVSTEWATPWSLYNKLKQRFSFTLDPCATKANAKCEKFYTLEQDRLSKSWKREIVFMNPPYGKEPPFWLKKAVLEASFNEAIIVSLIVPRSDAIWFQEAAKVAAEVWLLKGRVKFENPLSPKANAPQDPSCILVHTPRGVRIKEPILRFWDWKNEGCPS